MSDVFPMNKAPRDGREILAWSEAGNWHQVKWVDRHRDYAWLKDEEPVNRTYWGMRWHEDYSQSDANFKCWMYMPPPPKQFL